MLYRQFFTQRLIITPLPNTAFAKVALRPLAFLAMGIAALSLTACATQSGNDSHEKVVMVNGVPSYYVVREGDTLSHISTRYGLDYRRVAAMNGLNNDYKIYVGQHLRLINNGSASSRPTYQNSGYSQSGYSQSGYNRPAYTPMPAVPAQVLTQRKWLNPTSGSILKTFNTAAGTKGQWYTAAAGSPVVASQAGTVLYAGNQLTEYGNLVMIRHDSDFVSAYAHLGQFNVKEGQILQAGQQIGTVGLVNGTPTLEFQIRYRGTPVNPAQYLR